MSHHLPLVLFTFATLVASSVSHAADKPNIILLFADDISARELPLYGSTVWSPPEGGDTRDMQYRAETPVLDELANEGCWVKTTWATTVCSPSRAMMMTGRYAHRHKWWTNGDIGEVLRPNGNYEKWPLYESSPIQLGHIAQQAGYGTFWAGKTQMVGDLTRFGFDEGCFTPGNLSDKDNPYTDFKHIYRKQGGERILINVDSDKPADTYMQHGWYWYPHVRLMNHPSSSQEFQWWPNTAESRDDFGLHTYGPDVELDFVFEYMDRQQAKKEPFFVYHCSHLGHDAFDWFDPEENTKWPGAPIVHWDGTGYTRVEPKITGDEGQYDTHGTVTEPGIHNHVNYLDYQMWLYRRKLDKMGIADNTILIFCADNGTSGYGKHQSDRQKGTHVPLIIYAPGMTKLGEQDILVNLCDFLPTIADIVGAKIPSDYPIDGVSLWPYLTTDKAEHREWIYAYRGADTLIRNKYLMKDGNDRWWDVREQPDDLISYPKIDNWNDALELHREQRDRLTKIVEPFDQHDIEHDAPGTPPNPNASYGKKRKNKKQKPDQKKKGVLKN
ncbi:Arylsulfatase A [Neorhodopirellula lusitana]|uniref:Arylsulfatase A n=1 Tax=Neorhodopirellula lusitana TaxID=445327 RepID=A0ABY1PQ84_9BACT|nr:sulfatase-like hydrolase/transferase [Neorhodopirellula lusitana]SMP42224.1 Arylsulfatase A [Neorhodopirellula lusitana]